MKTLLSARTLAASLGVLAFGALAASPASAFDSVNWTWNKTVDEYIDIDACIDLDIDTTGMVEVENLQIFLGSVTATNIVCDVCYDFYDCYSKSWDVSEIKLSATAVGNLLSITSDVPVYLHDAQLLANTDGYNNPYCTEFDKLLADAGKAYGSNLHTDLALAFTYGAVFGDLSKATVAATNLVNGSWNATVDVSATAIGNLTQVTLESGLNGQYAGAGNICPDCDSTGDKLSNHVVIADITQFAYADVSAFNAIHGVHVNGEIADGKAIVNAVATAIGNAAIITVKVPDAP